MSREIAIIEKLEVELSLKQLQIRSLLTITQAINDNISQEALFDMYRSFLSWEMGIERMLLFVRGEDSWYVATGINETNTDIAKMTAMLEHHKRLHTVKPEDPEALKQFNIIIPVLHKDFPIAYSLIGGIKDKEDLYNKIQFITTITNIVSVAIENKRLFKRQLEQERYKREFELAKEVQSLLIPSNLPRTPRFEVGMIYKPHMNVGGDYIDYIKFDEDRFALCIADIAGKGVGAALLMANFQAIIQSLIFQYRDLETFVYALNQSVYRITRGEKFITFFVCEINMKALTLRYVNAGHYPPVLAKEDGSLRRLNAGCTVIGAFDKLPSIAEELLDIHHGDFLLCYTDGLADLKNESEMYFEETALDEMIVKNKHLDIDQFMAKIEETIHDFVVDDDYSDDIAVLGCKIV